MEQDNVIQHIRYATEFLTVGPNVHIYCTMACEAGYSVYPGEVDGFGWIRIKNGILLFG